MSAPASPLFAQVVVLAGAPNLTQPFTYGIPDNTEIQVGDCVLAPFGPRDVIGYVVGVTPDCPPEIFSKIRPIACKIEDAAGFDLRLWKIAQWVSNQTLCDIESAMRLIAPDITAARLKTAINLLDPDVEHESYPGEAREILRRLKSSRSNSLKLADIGKSAQITRALSTLRRDGVIERLTVVDTPSGRHKTVRFCALLLMPDEALEKADKLTKSGAHRQAKLLRDMAEGASGATSSGLPEAGRTVSAEYHAAAQALEAKGFVSYFKMTVNRDPFGMRALKSTSQPTLTDEQTSAALAIGAAIDRRDYAAFLIHGITGSGKTEVYMDAIARTRSQNRGALFLLPEISLTAQVMDLLKGRFGDDVAVLHSALTPGQWFDEWQRIRRGDANVVVGARSAVFAPIANLGLIVVDEEHDGSYKQDTNPRYNAREVAVRRARDLGAVCVLGSATPSIESFYHAKAGRLSLLKLTKRIGSKGLPPVNTVDLRISIKGMPMSGEPLPPHLRGILSPELLDALAARLLKQEQSILFLNRRGFAKFLLCRDCGFSFHCPNCAVALTYHREASTLQCHHCFHLENAPERCPKCKGTSLRPFGIGTEKVQEAVQTAFPNVRTLRMDRDTVTRKGAHGEILRAFKDHQADVLIGTQMVAKGLDFANVTLVGVINADTALNLPDFRASERAFQLVMQVAGRAGRGETKGEVFVQTFNPESDSIRFASKHDYDGFYDVEIENRNELRYPPFSHLANLICSNEMESQASDLCERLTEKLRQACIGAPVGSIDLLGPVACPLERLRTKYRHHVVVRSANKTTLLRVVKAAVSSMSQADLSSIAVDIDPSTML